MPSCQSVVRRSDPQPTWSRFDRGERVRDASPRVADRALLTVATVIPVLRLPDVARDIGGRLVHRSTCRHHTARGYRC